jgi:hypothetical protein
MLFTVMSPAPPSVLNVLVHSVDLMLHTLTVPSEEALQTAMTVIRHTLEPHNNTYVQSSYKNYEQLALTKHILPLCTDFTA